MPVAFFWRLANENKERGHMDLLPEELKVSLPKLYSQEKIVDPVVHAKFLHSGFKLDVVCDRRGTG
jgi:hypothetical protein